MRVHLSINVKNLKESVEFYSKVFGTKPQKQSSTYAKFDLLEPAFNFSNFKPSESSWTRSHERRGNRQMEGETELTKD